MSELFRQHLIAFLTSQDPNGVWSDEDTAAEGMPPTTADLAVPIVAGWAYDELSADVATGIVPAGTPFEQLHDYVDANKYGGAFDWPVLVGDVDDRDYVDAHCRFWNAVQDQLKEIAPHA